MKARSDSNFSSTGRGRPGRARPDAYLKPEAVAGLKVKNVGPVTPSGVITSSVAECARKTPASPQENAFTFPINNNLSLVDSFMNLLSIRLASGSEISEPVPNEGMFLLLIPICGVIQAKYWADALGLSSARSFELIEPLLYGPRKQFASVVS